MTLIGWGPLLRQKRSVTCPVFPSPRLTAPPASPQGIAAHSLQGKLAGLKPDELKKIRDGEPTGEARRDVLVSFVRTLAETSGTVSDDDFAAIKVAGYTDAQLLDISLAFATMVFTNVFNRINDTEIDFPAVAYSDCLAPRVHQGLRQ